ncbi:lactate utilization protein [Clostridium tyrobutyricum]|uniref:lactate utilization protein n=1 Tax=Clostridium tyrobutyricum TaxID=1519 RepID=UPI001C38B268|nr:lactate utilization protein [Clostridium tyrobutyricum]MBV4414985.1 lactate utilization protein [Clostridium tyrobutyricum]
MEINNVIKALEKNRYQVKFFETKEEAVLYFNSLFQNMLIGFGDSETMCQMNLHETLSVHNTVIDPKQSIDNSDFLRIAKDCLTTDIFLTSVNGLTEDGVIINLDGTGNRVAGSLFGHKKVYFIVGKNKIAPDLEKAIWRVRNIAAPKNAKRLELRTPCALKGDRCYNCSSPDRICNGLLIQLKKMNDIDMEVILINEDLGF